MSETAERIVEDEENTRLVALVRKIDEYLIKTHTADLFAMSAESLDRLPNGNPFIQKKMGNGLRIRGQLEKDKQTVTLQIFLDPLKFWAWTKSLGSVELFYMDPFGIEVCFKKSWQVSVDKKVVPLKESGDIYEAARIEVREVKGVRKLFRVT
jgi:hypothetical protein